FSPRVLGFSAATLAVFGLVVASYAPGTSSVPQVRPGPPPRACAKFAAEKGADSNRGTGRAPFRTAQRALNSLRSGQTGCLRSGTYTTSRRFVLDFSRSDVAVMGSPGERAVLQGIVVVRDGDTGVRLRPGSVMVRNRGNGVRLAGVSVEGVGGANTIQVYGADFVLEDSKITNGWRGR